MKKSVGWKIGWFFIAMTGAAGSQAAEVKFTSATDFTRIEAVLKDDEKSYPGIEMTVTLSPEATERNERITRESIGQNLTVWINGWEISTARVMSPVGSKFRVVIPKAIAKDVLPTLVD